MRVSMNVALSLALSLLECKSPCANNEEPAEGTCTCPDGTQVQPDECDVCDGLGAQELGALAAQDFGGSVRALCERALVFDLESSATLRIKLTAGAQAVSVALQETSTLTAVGQVGAPAGGDGDLVVNLERGNYRAVVKTQATQASFQLSLRPEPYVPDEREPEPGSATEDAQEIGDLSELRVFGGYVGATDNEDYYRFTLLENSAVTYGVSEVLGNVTAQLFPSAALLDEKQPYHAVQGATNSDGTKSINLERGAYYLRVVPGDAGTFYKLGVSAEPYSTPELDPEPPNDWQSASDLRVVAKTRIDLGGYVGGTDVEDFYKFELLENSALTFTLRKVDGGVTGQLYKSETQLNIATPFDVANVGETDVTHELGVSKGVYYFRVTPHSNTHSFYTLSLSAIEE